MKLKYKWLLKIIALITELHYAKYTINMHMVLLLKYFSLLSNFITVKMSLQNNRNSLQYVCYHQSFNIHQKNNKSHAYLSNQIKSCHAIVIRNVNQSFNVLRSVICGCRQFHVPCFEEAKWIKILVLCGTRYWYSA